MRTPNLFKNLGTWRGGVRSSIFVLSAFALLISIATLSKFNSLGSFHVTYALCSYVNTDQSQSRIDTMSRKLSKLKDEGVQCDYSLGNYQSRGTFCWKNACKSYLVLKCMHEINMLDD
ncbi:hypothetical protein ACFX15_000706 [Malus domestica]